MAVTLKKVFDLLLHWFKNKIKSGKKGREIQQIMKRKKNKKSLHFGGRDIALFCT